MTAGRTPWWNYGVPAVSALRRAAGHLPAPVLRHARAVRAIAAEDLNRGSRVRLLANYARWHLYHQPTGQPFLATLPNGRRTLVLPDSDSGVGNIYSHNVEQHELDLIRRVLRPGDFIVDVGCNVGNRTLALTDVIGGALLLDPNPLAVARATSNFLLNDLDMSRYHFVAKAAGSAPGWVEFTDLGGTDTNNRVVVEGGAGNGRDTAGAPTNKVAVTTVDDELRRLGETCAFIKSDAEGFDLEVLRGSTETLASGTVRLVMFERWAATPLDPFRSLFADLGWPLFTVDHRGAVTTAEEAILATRNVFAAPTLP